jgi:tRNA (guanine-N7-)-methyltransferase
MKSTSHKSKFVTSNQAGIHDKLDSILKRYSRENYIRPIAEFSHKTFNELLDWINSFDSRSVMLDMGCGTGQSSYELAKMYPENLVIGIDKSINRIDRNNDFKYQLPVNVKIVRGELLDLWYLFFQASKLNLLTIEKQYILFPNPWPKKKHVKLRFHANPIFPFILALSQNIELRTNWKIYAEEFLFACKFYGVKKVTTRQYIPKNVISSFELKYLESDHHLYKVEVIE